MCKGMKKRKSMFPCLLQEKLFFICSYNMLWGVAGLHTTLVEMALWCLSSGMSVCGVDESGARWNYNCPSGNYFEYQAHWVSFTSCKDIFEMHVWELCRLFAGRFDQGCSYCKRFKTRCCDFVVILLYMFSVAQNCFDHLILNVIGITLIK